jgi:hypothetical protein
MEVTYLAGPAISLYGVPATKSPAKGRKFLIRLLHVLLSISRPQSPHNPQSPQSKHPPLFLFILHFLSHLFVKTRNQCSPLHSLLSLSPTPNPSTRMKREERKKETTKNQPPFPPFSKNELDPGSRPSTSYRIPASPGAPYSYTAQVLITPPPRLPPLFPKFCSIYI